MELEYWEKFMTTGKIEDYLQYCEKNFQRTEEYKRESVDRSDRYCAVSEPDRGVR